jgi:hypothetical protein
MNYALDTPTKRNIYVPENDIPFSPAYQPKPASETDQSFRNMTWLHHKPQALGSIHINTESGRHKKK